MKFTSLLVLLLMLTTSYTSKGQNNPETYEEEVIKSVIASLFDGMREADSSKVKDLFYSKAVLMTSYIDKEGQQQLKQGELSRFISAVGSPRTDLWDERLSDTLIKIDDGIAHVWTPYQFYVNEQFSHCGVNSFQLAKNALGEWKIIHLIDTRRKERCK